MVKLIKLISGCLLGLCLVIWDSMSSITVAEFQVTSPILSYDHQIVAAAAAKAGDNQTRAVLESFDVHAVADVDTA